MVANVSYIKILIREALSVQFIFGTCISWKNGNISGKIMEFDPGIRLETLNIGICKPLEATLGLNLTPKAFSVS